MGELSANERTRYHRHLILEGLGEEGQQRIKDARVLVVGAGGLGCPAIQYLTATGVGHLSIMDDDVVDASNLQRQVFYGVNHLGMHKAIVATGLMQEMNQHVKIEKIVTRITYRNALRFVADYDVIMDCTDNLQARYVLSDACVFLNKPLVHGSVFKTQGQLSVFNYQNGPSYRCLFPRPENESLEKGPTLGIYSVLPGIIGLMQANEALKIISGFGQVLSGKMLLYSSLNEQVRYITIHRKPENFIREQVIKEFENHKQ